jgi:hypothetical protein
MISLTVNMEGDGALKGIGHVEEADSIEVLVLDGGMDSGKPSVTLHFTVDGRHTIAQTSARLFCTAAKVIEARYSDLFDES